MNSVKYEDTLDPRTINVLKLKAAQDIYMDLKNKKDNSSWNFKNTLLCNPHKYLYKCLESFGNVDANKRMSVTIPRTNHLLSALDLVIKHTNNSLPLNNIIDGIDIEIGGQRIDKISSLEEIKLNCQILNPQRKIKTIVQKSHLS